MRRRLALAALAGISFGAALALSPARADPPSATSPRRTLAECLSLAERAYPGLEAAAHKTLAARAQLDEAWVAPFLNFNVSGFLTLTPRAEGNPTFSPDAFGQSPFERPPGYIARATVETGVPISPWTWVRLGRARDAARAGVRVSEAERQRVRSELRHNVRRAFFALQFARDVTYLLDRADRWLDEARRQLDARRSSDAGGVSPNDDRQLRAYGAELRARRPEVLRGERVARMTLGLLTGEGESIDIPDLPLCLFEGDLGPVNRHLTRARIERPEVSMLRAGVSARRAALSAQRWAYLPDIALGVSAAISDASAIALQSNPFAANNANYAFWGAGLALRWTFDPLANTARVRRLSEELAMTEAQQRLALGGIALEVTEAYERTVEARDRERAWDDGERAANEWFTAVFQEYQSGAGDASALITPLRQYLTARFSHLQAIYDTAVGRSNLAYVTGQPDMEGSPAAECAAPPPPEDPDGGAPEGDGGANEDEIERLLRESAVADAGASGADAGTPARATTPVTPGRPLNAPRPGMRYTPRR